MGKRGNLTQSGAFMNTLGGGGGRRSQEKSASRKKEGGEGCLRSQRRNV